MRNSKEGAPTYRPIEDVGFDIERAAWEAGYPNWITWTADDLDAAYAVMESASGGEVVDDKDKKEG